MAPDIWDNNNQNTLTSDPFNTGTPLDDSDFYDLNISWYYDVLEDRHLSGVPKNVIRRNEHPEQLPRSSFIAFPNPFNPVATMNYELTKLSDVTIKIFDLRGREIMTLVNSTQPQGWYSVTWSGITNSGVPVGAGLYFAQLRDGENTLTLKMSYIK